MTTSWPPPITVLGADHPGGAYILYFHVETAQAIRFGRFKQGRTIPVPAGSYLYLGSAMGQRGAASLARRLVRHATRSGAQPAHPLRPALLAFFAPDPTRQAALLPQQGKRLFWNIDYLLDRTAVRLTHVLILRSQTRLEDPLARFLAQDPQTAILEKGLGANDNPGATHLLRLEAGPDWWAALPGRLEYLVNLQKSGGGR